MSQRNDDQRNDGRIENPNIMHKFKLIGENLEILRKNSNVSTDKIATNTINSLHENKQNHK